jgi:hypothetical protein
MAESLSSERPDYFKAPDAPEDRALREIKGDLRRRIVKEALKTQGLSDIPEDWTRHELREDFKQLLALEDPGNRGGEDLPDLEDAEVEIARVSNLDTVHREVTSLRARPAAGGKIELRMVDEYETEHKLPSDVLNQSMTAEELLRVFEFAEPCPLAVSSDIVFSSAFYPNLNATARALGIGPRTPDCEG